jgi:glycosyltransferase involved in cell wall biosynthesis
MTEAKLTIAIPTYNRAAHLQRQLARVAPQLTGQVRCCVYDNASTDDTSEVAGTYASQGVAYFRSAVNCGAGRNILRCFEECQTEWLWVLSDDDPIEPDAISAVLCLASQGSVDLIHLSSARAAYSQELVLTDPMALLEHSTPSAINFISLGVYRMDSFRRLLPVYVEQMTTMVPQMAMILKLLESGQGRVLLSPKVVLEGPVGPPRWPTLQWILGLCWVLEFTREERLQARLAATLAVDEFTWAFRVGLREANNPTGIRRWKRTYSLARQGFAVHSRFARSRYLLSNFYKAGRRKKCLDLLRTGLWLALLRRCPNRWFTAMASRLVPTGPAGPER